MTLPLVGPGSAALPRSQDRLSPPRRVDTLLGCAGPLALGAALLVEAVAPEALQTAAVPIAVTGLLIGVPHGAVDHLVPFWLGGRPASAGEFALVLGRYLLVAAIAAAAFIELPDAAFAAFLLASVVHFGRAEVQFDAGRRGTGAVPHGEQWLRTVAHGGVVVVLPFAVWPAQVSSTLSPLAPALAGTAAQPAWTALGAAAGALALTSVGLDLHGGKLREAAETTLLVTAVLALPPLVSFAVYFGAWHALRHTGRLLALPGRDGRLLDTRSALRRYAWHAAGPTLIVASVAAALIADASRSALTVALSVVLALTFPHMRTVAEWDRRAETLRGGTTGGDTR